MFLYKALKHREEEEGVQVRSLVVRRSTGEVTCFYSKLVIIACQVPDMKHF